MRTEIGAYLDPFADKLLLVSAFVVLTLENSFPAWLLGVVLIRDVVIVFGYFMFAFFTGERPPDAADLSRQGEHLPAALLRHRRARPREPEMAALLEWIACT